MATHIYKAKDRDDWLAYRKRGIGSSEIATIVGLNPFDTPYQLWRRLKGIDAPKEQNFAMLAGHYLEDAVAKFWQDATGREVIKASAGDIVAVNDAKEFLIASPDRTYWIPGLPRNNENKGVLECKTTQATIDPDDLPRHWFCQVQWQLGVMELHEGSLAWLSSGRAFDYRDIAFAPDFYGWLVEEAERFWTDHVKGDAEPTAINAADILAKYTTHTEGLVREVNEATLSAYRQLRECKARIKEEERLKNELEELIKLTFADAEAISYNGEILATWKASRPSNVFDSARFKAEHPELYNNYMTTKPGSRRFLIK